MPACVSVSMRSVLWTQTAGMCTSGVSASGTEGARSRVPADMRGLPVILILFPETGGWESLLPFPTRYGLCLPEIWGKHSLIWAIFLSHQVPSPLCREGLRPFDSFLAPASVCVRVCVLDFIEESQPP